MRKSIKYAKKEITVAIAASGVSDHRITLDRSYGKITGVRAYTLTDGDLPYYELGLRDNETNHHHLTCNADWQPELGHQYKPLNIENIGQDFTVSVNAPQAVATTDLLVQLVFVLEN